MAKKLHYFNLNGCAESIRYMLHYGGQKFEDVRHEQSTWPVKSIKDVLPFGQLPMYEEDNKPLGQSVAIARYVGSQNNLLPTDPWDQAQLDAIVLTIYDFWAKVATFHYEKDDVKKAEIKKVIVSETIDFYFSRFEKTLKEHNGFFGGQLSWADFVVVGMVDLVDSVLEIELGKSYPTVKLLVQKIRSLPGVKEYIANKDSAV